MIKSALTISACFSTCILLSACGNQPITPSSSHLREAPQAPGSIPEPVRQSTMLMPPKPTAKQETFSVTVYNVPVQSLLFALARDAKLNVDVHPGIQGNVTLNAINQTLPQLLTRISQQVDMRFEVDGPNLIVTPDNPYLRNYKIDYVNISRNSESKISIATQISSAGGSVVGGGGGGSGDNNSTTTVTDISNNQFWGTLVQNIKDILFETDKTFPDNADGSPVAAEPVVAGKAAIAAPRIPKFREAASVIANPEASLISVRATSRQHEKIQEFLDIAMSTAKRQVLIEATVVEVQLSRNYQQGINWSSLKDSGFSFSQGKFGTTPLPSGVNPAISPSIFSLEYAKSSTQFGTLAAAINLLESFGKVKVLSSPKISVLNNQTAILKVVDNEVYFLITATTTLGTNDTPATSVYTSELRTVPVGFVMSVTPQISESDEVSINVRPSISRIIAYVQDPNPALAQATVVSRIPVIQTREMESIIKVPSGQIAVMGGLMQDSVNNNRDGVPLLSRIPVVGDAFSYRDDTTTKSELVIFIRPIVVKSASVNGDYKDYRSFLPDGKPLSKDPLQELNNNGASGS